ncbi:AcrR family transcriptional regulator [Mumia flava]|uniref:AcrR family transcriptional regulator n=1 Tax=Mumia flava TaxID=1348852 RepID=A0A2M9BGW1_9ACTN|nr:TetR/AcrR family transcriptional regulator [Mumia flava]PJJ57169.1 AcrR family transcriptional regulator [Mumia flava]
MPQLSPARRAQVLGPALRVFARNGYRATSMQLLADATELSRPALYQYFPNKRGVFRAAVAFALDGAVHDVRAAAAGAGPPRQRLLDVLRHVLVFYDGPELGRIRAELIDQTYAQAGDLWEGFETALLDAVERVLCEAGVGEADETAVVVVYGVEGIALKSTDRTARDRAVARLVDLALTASTR